MATMNQLKKIYKVTGSIVGSGDFRFYVECDSKLGSANAIEDYLKRAGLTPDPRSIFAQEATEKEIASARTHRILKTERVGA